ncbi:LOW QUALITY PROTEIN: synaptotagmin-12 [Sarcoramphus papa]
MDNGHVSRYHLSPFQHSVLSPRKWAGTSRKWVSSSAGICTWSYSEVGASKGLVCPNFAPLPWQERLLLKEGAPRRDAGGLPGSALDWCWFSRWCDGGWCNAATTAQCTIAGLLCPPRFAATSLAFSSLDPVSSSCGVFPLFPKAFCLGWFGFVFFSYFWIFLASLAGGKPGRGEGFPAVERAMQACTERICERDGPVAGERTPPHPWGDLRAGAEAAEEGASALGLRLAHGASRPLAVATSPPRWEIGIYAAGALVLLGIAAVNLWKLWRSGSYPAPSPFPNYDYRYLEQKYGAAYSDIKHKRGMAPGSQRALDKTSPIRKTSLRADDTFESINELGSLELMSKDLGLASYGPLKKSISADSLSSVSSIGNNFGQDFTVGQVEVSMEYDGKAAALHVTLLQGKDLLEKEDARFESCFMRISLLPAEQIVGISRIQRSAYAVAFDERFSIPLDPAALEENSLRFSVFGIDEDERNVSTGVAELKLSDLDLATRPFNAWLYLQDMNKAVDTVGEILLSLSYLPTAERLTVVVVKAKNLVWTNGKVTADPFVKVYLLQDGRKISKKKTAVKRDDTNPVFNEAMIFSVPAIVLQDLSLRVTVAECGEDGRADNTGHVLIGPAASGMGITHWNQMLATLRKPVSMWHPLRRN